MITICKNYAELMAALADPETTEIEVSSQEQQYDIKQGELNTDNIKCTHLKKITFGSIKFIPYELLAAIINLPSLEDLDVAGALITGKVLPTKINAKLPNLKRLRISGTSFNNTGQEEAFAARILDGAKKLQELRARFGFFHYFPQSFWQKRDLTNLKALGLGESSVLNAKVTDILKTTPNLENLEVGIFGLSTNKDLAMTKLKSIKTGGSVPDLIRIWEKSTGLKELKFAVVDSHLTPPTGLKRDFCLYAEQLDNVNLNVIQSLNLEGVQVDVETFLKIIESSSLEKLELNNVNLENFRPNSFLNLEHSSIKLKSLSMLKVKGVTLAAICELARYCTNLEAINIEPPSAGELADTKSILERQMLQSINLSNVKVLRLAGMKIDLSVFLELIAKAEKLETLHVSECEIIGLTPEDIRQMKLPNLVNVIFEYNTLALEEDYPRLQSLLSRRDELKDQYETAEGLLEQEQLIDEMETIYERINFIKDTEEILIQASMLQHAPLACENFNTIANFFKQLQKIDPENNLRWNPEMCYLATKLFDSKNWKYIDDDFMKRYLLNYTEYLTKPAAKAYFIQDRFKNLLPEQRLRLIEREDMFHFFATKAKDFLSSGTIKLKDPLSKMFDEIRDPEHHQMQIIKAIFLPRVKPRVRAGVKKKNSNRLF